MVAPGWLPSLNYKAKMTTMWTRTKPVTVDRCHLYALPIRQNGKNSSSSSIKECLCGLTTEHKSAVLNLKPFKACNPSHLR